MFTEDGLIWRIWSRLPGTAAAEGTGAQRERSKMLCEPRGQGLHSPRGRESSPPEKTSQAAPHLPAKVTAVASSTRSDHTWGREVPVGLSSSLLLRPGTQTMRFYSCFLSGSFASLWFKESL